MLHWAIETSIRFRLLVPPSRPGCWSSGSSSCARAGRRAARVHPPYVEVQTEALGLSAAEVEQLITVPLEADLLNGVPGSTRSAPTRCPGCRRSTWSSSPAPTYRARQLVAGAADAGARAAQRLHAAGRCCSRVSSTSRVMMIGLSSATAVADRAVGARPLDDPAPAAGRARAWPTSRSGASATASCRSRSTRSGCADGVTLTQVIGPPATRCWSRR